MSATDSGLAERPAHVRPEWVLDFDLFNLPGAQEDVQLAMRAFQQAGPDLFWTPRNGGHWVATRAGAIETLQRDYARFSSDSYLIPKKPPEMPKEIPLECDPPRHTTLRRPLTATLTPRVVRGLDDRIRALCIELIENVYARGSCEFIGEIGQVLPISIFLDLVELPREDRLMLKPITQQVVHSPTQAGRAEGFQQINEYLAPFIRARRENPGTDLLSAVVNAPDGDAKISEANAFCYASIVLFGGLDTVSSTLGFVARYLARNPGTRREIIENLDDESFMRTASEELLRRHGVALTARVVVSDTELAGLPLKRGEMVLVLHPLTGLDERVVPDPLTLNLRRNPIGSHAIFSSGAHSCPGSVLARHELSIFLQEWLRRIPDYDVMPGTVPKTTTAPVSCLTEMYLSWQPEADAR
jgi:cytochrome P450